MKVKLLSLVRLLATPWTAAYQAPLSMGFSRQEYWSGVPLPSPEYLEELGITVFPSQGPAIFWLSLQKIVEATLWAQTGVRGKSVKQEGRGEGTTFERMT